MPEVLSERVRILNTVIRFITLKTRECECEVKMEQKSSDYSTFSMVLPQDKYPGAVVLTFYSIPTG